jgi:small subunit ribosomal protein S11
MARISGVDIPREKRLEIALTYIYGIGRATSAKMCKELELSPDTRVRNLTDSEVNKIRMYIENGLTVEGDLRRNVQTDIKRKIEIGSYQGTRHRKGLPVRGQRTHTNARTRKGPKIMAKAPVRRTRKRDRKNVTTGVVHIKSSFNNTIVSITDTEGNVIAWASSGGVGFSGSRKSTPFAAQMAAEKAGRAAMEQGLRRAEVHVKGPGSGRDTALRSIQQLGIEVSGIKDVSPIPHNGCLQPKRKRP